MKEQGQGVMTLTSSTAGLFGYPYDRLMPPRNGDCRADQNTGDGTRAVRHPRQRDLPGAVEGDRMDRVIANEAKARGMSADELRQGYADLVSLKRFVSAADIANMAVFLASPKPPMSPAWPWRLTAIPRKSLSDRCCAENATAAMRGPFF